MHRNYFGKLVNFMKMSTIGFQSLGMRIPMDSAFS